MTIDKIKGNNMEDLETKKVPGGRAVELSDNIDFAVIRLGNTYRLCFTDRDDDTLINEPDLGKADLSKVSRFIEYMRTL